MTVRPALPLIVLAAALAAATYAWLALRPAPPFDPARYPIHGVDVSHHQGVVTWGRLKRQGVAFAYVKASEGSEDRDPLYHAAAVQAREAGLKVGAYHFFSLCRPGADQASNFLAAMDASSTDLPPAVDVEYRGNCRSRRPREAMVRELGAFLDAVERGSGHRPILYLTPDAFHDLVAGTSLEQAPLWMQAAGGPPAKGAHVLIRQYAAQGRLDGVDGPVDLDAFIGSRTAFEAWAKGGR